MSTHYRGMKPFRRQDVQYRTRVACVFCWAFFELKQCHQFNCRTDSAEANDGVSDPCAVAYAAAARPAAIHKPSSSRWRMTSAQNAPRAALIDRQADTEEAPPGLETVAESAANCTMRSISRCGSLHGGPSVSEPGLGGWQGARKGIVLRWTHRLSAQGSPSRWAHSPTPIA